MEEERRKHFPLTERSETRGHEAKVMFTKMKSNTSRIILHSECEGLKHIVDNNSYSTAVFRRELENCRKEKKPLAGLWERAGFWDELECCYIVSMN